MVKISCSEDAYNQIKTEFDDFQEKVLIVGVNSKNQFMYKKVVGLGDVDFAVISSKVIFRDLLMNKCYRFFLFHNHPSKDLTPSEEDLQTTARLLKQCKIMGFALLDHIIFSNIAYHSLFDNDEGGF